MTSYSRIRQVLILLAVSLWGAFLPSQANPVPGPGTQEDWGRYLRLDQGCVGCHAIAGTEWEKNGPPLDRMASKVDASWLVAWIQDPRSLHPRSRMPFFGLDEDQSLAVAAYLVRSSSPSGFESGSPTAGDPREGERLVAEIGCLGCHSLDPPDKDQVHPIKWSLAGIGGKVHSEWLVHWLKNPAGLDLGTPMPNLRLSDEEARHIAAYLSELKDGSNLEQVSFPEGTEFEELASEGKDLIEEKGCYGCHAINGFETMERIGSEIEDWTAEDFTDIHQTGEETDLLVPQFYLPETDIEAIAAASKSDHQQENPAAALAEGRLLVQRYQCTACHRVERLPEGGYWGGEVKDWIEDPGYDPPPLFGEGSKIRTPWLREYLSEVVVVRPWLKARMPSFAFRQGEVETLVAYFKALEGVPVEENLEEPEQASDSHLLAGTLLFAGFQCIKCHPVNADMMAEISDLSTLAPDLSMATRRLRYPWLHTWLLDPQSVAPGTRMPDYFPDRGSEGNTSIAYQMVNAKENPHLKKSFLELMDEEEMKKNLEDSDWVVDRLNEFLWNFESEDYFARFPWTPPAKTEESGKP